MLIYFSELCANAFWSRSDALYLPEAQSKSTLCITTAFGSTPKVLPKLLNCSQDTFTRHTNLVPVWVCVCVHVEPLGLRLTYITQTNMVVSLASENFYRTHNEAQTLLHYRFSHNLVWSMLYLFVFVSFESTIEKNTCIGVLKLIWSGWL